MHKKLFSEEIARKLLKVIPGGVSSPVRAFKEVGVKPMIVERGEKDCIFDIDGNCFVDFCGSWGALIHGHAHPVILESVLTKMKKGTTFGITTEAEERLARKLVNLVDSVEKVRFVNSGTEATMSAARLSRGFTGRETLVKFDGNYHGHADFFLVKAGSGVTGITAASSSAGIPKGVVKDVVSLPYNDVEMARKFLRENLVASVILEPIAGNMGVVPASQEFICMLREETKKQGALLIFDEVITGFRVAQKGGQSLYHTAADLTCFGKVIGGGFPVAAFGGRADIMAHLAPEGPVYQAGTLSGNPVAMEAGLQALSLLEKEGFYRELDEKAKIITEPVKEFIEEKHLNMCLQSQGSMFTLFFGRRSVRNQEEAKKCNTDFFARFFRYLYSNGVYIPPSQFEACFVSFAHERKNLEKARDLILDFIAKEIRISC